MPLKGQGLADDSETTRWEGGLTWIAYPDEQMRRASHALVTNGDAGDADVWLVDPVDTATLDERLDDLGSVAGVVVLLDRHKRDSVAVARRYDVPVYVHATMDGVAEELSPAVDIERFDAELADSGFRTIRVLDRSFWTEVALLDPDAGTLVVPEAVGTNSYFVTGGERLGVHPMLRAVPPRGALGGLRPERIAVGHGRPVTEDAASVLEDALSSARKNAPSLYLKNLTGLLPV
jgi:hypothetical protein